MANAEGISCQICLNADEPQDVLDVEILHHRVLREARVSICLFCAEAIARAAAARGFELGQEEVTVDARGHSAAGSLRDSVHAAAPVHPLGVGDQPDDSAPGEHRREPEAAAGGEGLRSQDAQNGVEGEVMEKPVEDGK